VLERQTQPEGGGVQGWCELWSAVDAALDLLSHRTRGVSVQRERGAAAQVAASPRAVHQILFNLFDHALRASARQLWIRVEVEAEWLSLVVADDGTDVQELQLLRLFDPFYPARGGAGTASLTLHLSRRLVEDAGGTLTARHRRGGGVEVVMRMPRVANRVAARARELGSFAQP
jgi:signal transduction histidine kinase